MTNPTNRPMVSVIICAFNTAEYLGECLDSVLAQSYDVFEIVITNDGSTDDTQKIIDRYVGRYPNRITAFSQENSGVSAARNRGLDAAHGEFVSFVDSDDTISPDFLLLLVEKALVSGAQVVSCGFDKVENNIAIASFTPSDWDVCLGGKCYSTMVVIWSRIYRRDFLNRNGLRFCENEFFEDVAFSLSVNFLAAGIACISLLGYHYRIREHSIMSKAGKGLIDPKKLPFRGVEQAFLKIRAHVKEDSFQAFEFAAVKAMTGLLFQVMRKNNRQTVRAMSAFCTGMMTKHFPHVMRNRYITLHGIKGYPFVRRAALVVFKYACRLGILYPVAYMITRF